MQKKNLIYVALAFTIVVVTYLTSYTKQESKLEEKEESMSSAFLPQMVKSVNMNKAFSLAGEQLPTDNFDVFQRLDNELTLNAYRHGSTSLNMKKAGRYFPIIEPIFKENGVPDDLKYITVAESDFRNATSPAGAKGFWQFMPSVGKEYGLEINSEVDERYHLEKSTVAACKLLKNYKKGLGSWTLATAAYNGGYGRISRALESQGGADLFDLNLNRETSRYVFRVIAIKEIMSNPKEFGFYLEEEDLYPAMNDYYIVEVNSAIENLADFAQNNGISYRKLKEYNPWLLRNKLTNPRRKTYQIKIPYQKY